MVHLSFLPCIFKSILRCASIMLETSNLMQKKERKSSFEGYALQYHVLDTVSGATFFPPKIYFDKGSLQLQGEGKNYVSKVFFVLVS